MDTLTALTTRVSIPRLTDPGPSPRHIEQLLQAALRAPDHGLLRPWRFIVLQGEQRQQLGDIMERRLLREQPDADEGTRRKARDKALRAPAIIIVVAEVTEQHKIPVWEQVVAVGAAVQNMMVAAHALGLGAMWRTGALAADDQVKQELGFASKDRVVAFLYLGTQAGTRKPLPEQNVASYMRELP